MALHLVNGAVFGAAYANVAPSLPVPRAARGRWPGWPSTSRHGPGTAVLDRVHPARRPAHAVGLGRAFAQATWRHVLFGVVLGELERRLNPPEEIVAPVDDAVVSTNGHGSVEHVVPRRV